MPLKISPVQYSGDEVGIPIMKLGEVLFARRWNDCLRHSKELKHLKREIRVRTIEWFFLFQKGPHKFVHGTYPKPSGKLLNRLLEKVFTAIRIYRNEKQAVALKELVDELDHGQFLNLILFLLLISEVRCEETTLGTVRIPNEVLTADITLETDTAPKYSTFDCSKLSSGSLNVTNLSANSQVVGGAMKALRKNPFTNMIDFYGHEPSVTHFFGAFTVLGPEAKQLLREAGSAPLKIPVGLNHELTKYRYLHSCDTSPQVEEDEGYSDSSVRRRFPLTFDNERIRKSLVALLGHTTMGVCDFVLETLLHPFSAESNRFGSLGGVRLTSKEMNPICSANSKEKRYQWTNRGVCMSEKEKPFLTESGPWAAGALFHSRRERFSSLPATSTFHNQASVYVDSIVPETMTGIKAAKYRSEFFRDLILLRLGIQSSRFRWDVPNEKDQPKATEPLVGQFVYHPYDLDGMVLGFSGVALTNSLSSQLLAGTYYRRLSWLARNVISLTPVVGKPWHGPTWACFANALTTWLSAYEEALQHVLGQCERWTMDDCTADKRSRPLGLLLLIQRLKKLTDRINFVANLCMLTEASCPLLRVRGIELLTHLVSIADQFACSPVEPLVRFFFRHACKPFLNFLERLLVDGVHDESVNEFNLHVSNVHLLKRDVSFWVGSFRYETRASGAGFMNLLPTHFEHYVLRCAKSIQLLKSVAPKHFIFKSRMNFPSLLFPASSSEVIDQQNSLSSYLDELEKSALLAQSTRLQQLMRATHQRQELLRLAAETHARNLIEFTANEQRIRDAHRAKQEQAFIELKMAAEQAVDRRHTAIEAEKAVDKTILEAASRLEAHRKDVIAAASNELEAHYAALSRDADLRRLKAGQRIQENQFISEVLHKDGLKAQEFQVNRATASVSFKGDECIPMDPLSDVNTSRRDSTAQKVAEEPHDESVHAVNGYPTDSVSQPLASNDQRTQVEATVQSSFTEVTDLSDPLALVKTKFRQQNSAVCAPSEQMFDILYVRERSPNPQSESPDESLIFMADSKKPSAVDSVVRFRDRNRHGHVSDSTVQRMLYGSGSGPACRPSEWSAECTALDVAKIDTEQPDAVTFYRESLEPDTDGTAFSNSLSFTKEFPDLNRPVLLNPFQHVKSSTPPVLRCNTDAETTVINLNLIPLRVLLDKIVLLPLTSYIQSVDRTLCDHLLYNLGLMEHLNCLRQVCFLENGTFAQLLCDGLFEMATGNLASRSAVHNVGFLHDMMQSVIKTFLPSPEEVDIEDCFYRWIDDSAPLIIRAPIDLISSKSYHEEPGRSDNRFSPISFDHLTIIYHAPWPLNILIHPDVVLKYNLVFRQLIRVKFAVWALNAAYHRLRQLNTTQLSPTASASLHQVTLWLHEMDQVVRGLEAYLGNQAVKANWSKFAARLTGTFVNSLSSSAHDLHLKQVTHLEELAEAHESYLNEVTQCCLLDSADREIQQVVQGLLACVHWFHKVLTTIRWPTCSTSIDGLERNRHAGLEQLQSAHQSFRQHARFLRLRAGRLLSARSGNQASFNLNHLITALGTNDFFAHVDLRQT
ncbi:hypothetical protein PHET_05037 [Paragonimus heterotremus]|uniref:Gamma-tubulin complex component 6 n=1 Tax=Paragonimus heterotremus TaxID=100268 RepID=A0A8J4WRT0_9TREM|nr:hypothetical protein PHET_05037 [Paragonimus heterotremus]